MKVQRMLCGWLFSWLVGWWAADGRAVGWLGGWAVGRLDGWVVANSGMCLVYGSVWVSALNFGV